MTLKVGLVGVGSWGKHILRDLRTLGAEVHCVARSSDSIARAREGGATSVVDDAKKLGDCAGYVVANRTSSHLDAVEALLPRVRPIFVEKPLSNDVARAKALPRSAYDLVFVMHKWRYHPGIIALSKLARDQEYGPPAGLRTFRVQWGGGHADVSPIWTLMPHDMSIALAIFGEVPEVVDVIPDPMRSKANGVIARLRTSSGLPIVTEISTGHPTGLRRIMLHCRDAVAQLEDQNYGAIAIKRFGEASALTLRVGDELPLYAELKAFVGHLHGGLPPQTTLAEELLMLDRIKQIEAALAQQ